MSTNSIRKVTCRFIFIIGVCLAASSFSSASTQEPRIEIRLPPDSQRAVVDVSSATASSWSFLDSYAGMVGLGRRIERFVAFDTSGGEISLREVAPGQYQSNQQASRVQYEVDLRPPSRSADSAMISWVDNDRGVLLLSDLLPLVSGETARTANLRIHFQLPKGWEVHSGELEGAVDDFTVPDVGRAVFAIGAHLRAAQVDVSGMTLKLITSGDWAFSDADVLQLAQQVLKAHRDTFRASPGKRAGLILFPFPSAVSATKWGAETRGTTVTLLSGRSPSKVAGLAQLSTPLTHEFFHLWIPNALALEGDYDWFYEGFTVYEAAQTALRLGLLTFPEFLNSIAQAYDSSKGATNLSLIEASKRRFTVGVGSVYAKSQVVAFLYDLRLHRMSRNKRSLSDTYAKLIAGSKTDNLNARDGNAVAITALNELIGSDEFARAFISNPVSINLSEELAPFGLKVGSVGLRTQISVDDKLSKQQRDLLRELGYNAGTHASR